MARKKTIALEMINDKLCFALVFFFLDTVNVFYRQYNFRSVCIGGIFNSCHCELISDSDSYDAFVFPADGFWH